MRTQVVSFRAGNDEWTQILELCRKWQNANKIDGANTIRILRESGGDRGVIVVDGPDEAVLKAFVDRPDVVALFEAASALTLREPGYYEADNVRL